MASISEFKAKLKGGGARSNLFEVEINFPTYAGGSNETEAGLFLAKSASLPSMTVGVIEVPYQGRMFPMAGDRTFVEWTVTFINDTDFLLRDAFEKWSNAINGNESNEGFSNPVDYMRDIGIFQLDKEKKRVKEYLLQDGWPTEVGQIDVSMDSTDTIEEFTVTFRYLQWSSDTTS